MSNDTPLSMPPLSPDDPRLTAYALGELEGADLAAVEAAVAVDPQLARVVAEIRAAAEKLTAALAAEPAPASAIEKNADNVVAFTAKAEAADGSNPVAGGADPGRKSIASEPASPRPATESSRKRRRFLEEPRRFPYFLVSGLAAAAFAAAYLFTPVGRVSESSRQVYEVDLGRLEELPSPVSADSSEEAIEQTLAFAPPASAFRASPPRPSFLTPQPGQSPAFNTESYAFLRDHDFVAVRDQPLSTFSIDADTASYTNVRRFLDSGARPPADAVRIEELLNFFRYDYPAPAAGDTAPFAASLEVAAAPWEPQHRLARIGLKGREVAAADRPAANLVFLVDVSGSMQPENKLPLVRESLRMLVDELQPRDRVALAVYAGASGLVLPSTPVARRDEIIAAIDQLGASGSTNGAMGIHLAYDIAKANFVPGGVNRVVLATDGDFNVGVTSQGELVRLIEEKARSGVFLSVLGFGMGNLKDSTLEQLADKGNGAYAYIDSQREARRVFVEQATGTLLTIAKDVKIQVEFNPAEVQAYRLIGYENRVLAKEDFNNDKVDAGEIGAGHTVTALYELIPAGAPWQAPVPVDPLRYQMPSLANRESGSENRKSAELLTIKLRYKQPAGETSSLLEFPLTDGKAAFEQASTDFRFAASVAAFGMILRESPHRGPVTMEDVVAWADHSRGADPHGYRSELVALAKKALPLYAAVARPATTPAR
jgi:Ca-activated chloride channel homolog